jgi:outer membrane protein assembly factor BamB
MMNFLKAIFFAFILVSCNSKKDERHYETLYLTTNANDVYVFDIENKKNIWKFPAFNPEVNDELCYFTIADKELIKSYQDGTIIQLDKKNGTVIKKYQDKEDETQSYFGYDFVNVAFLHFYQYPQMFQGNAIFTNSHGEIKSIDLKTQTKNWVYIQNQIIYSSPKVANNIVYANTNYEILALNAKTGKILFKTSLEEVSTNELVIENDKIYILGETNTLMCFNLKLEKKWTLKVEDYNKSSTHNLLITENSIYFGGSTVFSADKNTGALEWKTKIYNKENSQKRLLSIEKNEDGIMVMTSEKLIKINEDGKTVTTKNCKEALIGKLFYCNDWYYYLTKKGSLMRIKSDLNQAEVFYKGINTDPNHRVDDTYFYAE